MNKMYGVIGLSLILFSFSAESSQTLTNVFAVSVPYEKHHYRKDCADFSESVKRFSDKLNDKNLKIFCEKFNDAQREKAMQLSDQKGITPDQAVEAISKAW